MKTLRGLSSGTKRLFLLTVTAAALAIPALAGCESLNATCPNGQETGATVCCEAGQVGGAECVCSFWSSSGGYSGCHLVTICYTPATNEGFAAVESGNE